MSYCAIPMVPGPTSVHPDVLAAMHADFPSADTEPAFIPLYHETSRQLARLMGTKNDVVIMSGEGMLALWGAMKSCLRPGDPVLCVGTGLFGDGNANMARALGCRVELVSQPYDTVIDDATLERVEDAAKRLHPVMITAVHGETPSGTLNPLAALGKLKKDLGISLFHVDAVASLGGCPVEADKWNIDLLLGGSQKCLSCPPSMCMVGVSPAAWERIRDVNYQGYDALLPFMDAEKKGLFPYTPNWHGVSALSAGCNALLKEGLKKVFARHEKCAEMCRKGLTSLGIRLYPKSEEACAPTVTAALVPDGMTWKEWDSRLRASGLVCGGDYGCLAGKVFRLGHMGTQAQPCLVEEALKVIAGALGR